MTPTVDQYVEAFLGAISQAGRMKERTVFTRAGKMTVRNDGETVIYGPGGYPIRVVTKIDGAQVETDDRLHAVVRPPLVTIQGR